MEASQDEWLLDVELTLWKVKAWSTVEKPLLRDQLVSEMHVHAPVAAASPWPLPFASFSCLWSDCGAACICRTMCSVSAAILAAVAACSAVACAQRDLAYTIVAALAVAGAFAVAVIVATTVAVAAAAIVACVSSVVLAA